MSDWRHVGVRMASVANDVACKVPDTNIIQARDLGKLLTCLAV
jgi:hypothetical protein